jgi:hypothetical protein
MKHAIVLLLLVAGVAHAHDLRPGILAFVEDAPGELRMRFVPPVDNRGEAIELAVVLPDGCTRKGDRVRCTDGFGGTLAIAGMRGHAMKVYLSLERDGIRNDWVITSDSPRLELGAAPSRIDRLGIVALALLAGLVLLFGPSLRLLVAVAAFVAGEAIAGLVTIAGPFAALAAVSVVLVARESIVGLAGTALQRWPWLAGAVFGVVHGLAFAPRPVYLLGQLACAGVIAALVALATHFIGERRDVGMRIAAYVLGAVAVYWLLAGAVA